MEKDRLWILLSRKLTGEASRTVLTELEELAARFPETHPARQAIEATWNGKNPVDDEFLEATYLQHLERLKARGYSMPPDKESLTDRVADEPYASKPTVLGQLLLGILVAALFISTWLIIDKPKSKDKEEPNRVSTKNGSRTKLLLPDGSGVWLNAGSTLTYNKKFDGKIRDVQLTGEAFFDVIKNPERPFIIRTSKMDVKVLGTQFNVKAYPDDKEFETSLIKGSVEVYPANRQGEKFVLKPKQKFVLAKINPLVTPTKAQNNNAGRESIEINIA